MVTQQLIDYILSQKQQNISGESIRESLLKSNWSIDDINQAFFQIISSKEPQDSLSNQSPPSVVPIANPTSSIKTNVSTEKKPKIIKIISLLIFILASIYIFSTVSFLGIVIVMERSMSAGGLVFSILKYFPAFGVLPILFSFVTLFFFYLAFKIRNGSRFSWWLGIFSPIPVTVSVSLFSLQLILPIYKMTSIYGGITPPPPLKTSSFNFTDPVFILTVIISVLFALAYKKFHFGNVAISNKAKIFLIIVVVIFVVPTISVISLDYIKAYDTDYGYTKVKTEAGYHVYKPSSLPNGLECVTKFILGKELAGKQNAIQVAYDIRVDWLMKGIPSRPIVIKQVGVESGFDINTFAATYIKDATVRKITLSKAVNQSGYLLQKPLGKSTLSYVVYLTEDNVLITLGSPKATPEELIALTESLK